MAAKIKIGLVGWGKIAKTHAAALASLEEADFPAGWDTRERRARERAGRGDRATGRGSAGHLSSQLGKQGLAQFFFRIAQLVTEGGLREVKALSRLGDAAFLGHGHQQLEVTDFQFRVHFHV